MPTKVARETGLTPTQVSRMRNLDASDPKKYQRITDDSLPAIAKSLNALPPGYEGMTSWLNGSDAEPATGNAHSDESHAGTIGVPHAPFVDDFEALKSQLGAPIQTTSAAAQTTMPREAHDLDEPIIGERAIRSVLSRIVGLDEGNVQQVLSVITAMIARNRAKSK